MATQDRLMVDHVAKALSVDWGNAPEGIYFESEIRNGNLVQIPYPEWHNFRQQAAVAIEAVNSYPIMGIDEKAFSGALAFCQGVPATAPRDLIEAYEAAKHRNKDSGNATKTRGENGL